MCGFVSLFTRSGRGGSPEPVDEAPNPSSFVTNAPRARPVALPFRLVFICLPVETQTPFP
jgi:hypothetical protein